MLRRFCFELKKNKAQNVALLVDGDEKIASCVADVLKQTGTNYIDNIKYIKISGLPFFAGKFTDEEKADVLKWVHEIVDSIQ